jgi:type IV pilus assembly protein PilB
MTAYASLSIVQSYTLQNYNPNWLTHSGLSLEFIRHHQIIPFEQKNNILYLGLADISNQEILAAVKFQTGLQIAPVYISEKELWQFISMHCHQDQKLQMGLLNTISLEENLSLLQENNHYDEPLIQFVDNIIGHGVRQKASDIHIEPYENTSRIRFRQHGVLYEVVSLSNSITARLIMRLKIMAKLDITETRLPQDGRIQLNSIDIRINTCPTLNGEKIVLRLLSSAQISLATDTLGFTQAQHKIFLAAISKSQGMIIVTGPTGSGKTMTLYAALNYLNTIEKNISSVEDPIEIKLPGINQVNINPKINFHFATALRSLLRQDPDIIMVGEIRDPETAGIALQAAQTGHLVLTSLHTNNAIAALQRLQSLGVANFNLSSAISLIIAQRLVRTLCENCKIPTPCINSKLEYGPSPGCNQCVNGFSNRTAIYEILPISARLRQLIASNADQEDLLAQAKKEGFVSLAEHGIKLVAAGITTATEINRVLSL